MLLEFQQISKRFGDLPVIRDFNLSLMAGEVVSLVGPSGCGKSTLLRLAAGVETPEGGEIKRTFGVDRVGFVFQDVRLLPWMTALDNVLFVLRDRISDRDLRHDKAERALQQVGLADFGGYKPGQLSGGMRKRVAIARALAVDADLLLFDEPFSDLDLPLRLRLLEDIGGILKRGGKSAIYVTHDVREALLLSQRVLVLAARPTYIKQIFHLPVYISKSDTKAIEEQVIRLLADEIDYTRFGPNAP